MIDARTCNATTSRCGPDAPGASAFVKSTVAQLKAASIDPSQIKRDQFYGSRLRADLSGGAEPEQSWANSRTGA